MRKGGVSDGFQVSGLSNQVEFQFCLQEWKQFCEAWNLAGGVGALKKEKQVTKTKLDLNMDI